MRIDRIHIDGFGRLCGVRLSLGPGLNVLHGENEAGKSTLLAFIRSVLFRFRGRTDPLRFAPESGAFGGELHLSTDRGPLVVRRFGGRRVEGDVTLRGMHGAPEPASRLREALSGVSEELFSQVFAFSLTELEEFRAMAEETSVSEALFAAGMQGARRLPEVAQALRRSSDEIWKAGPGGKKPLNLVLAELERVRRELEALGRPPERYFELVQLAARLEEEVKETEGRLESARGERERLARLQRAAPELSALERIQVKLRSYPRELQAFPADGMARLDASEQWLSRCGARIEELTAGLEQAAATLAQLAASVLPPPALASLRTALEGFDRRSSLRDGLPGRNAELEARRNEAGRRLRGLGLPVDPESLLALDLGSAARAQLVALRTKLRDAERSAADLQAELRQHQQRAAEARAEVARRASERDALCPTPLAELRVRFTALRRVPLLRTEARRSQEQREDLLREQAEISSEVEPPPAPPASPWWVAPAAAFALSATVAAYFALGAVWAGAALVVSLAMVGSLAVAHRSVAQARRDARAAWDARNRRREEQLGRIDIELAAVEERVSRTTAALEAAVGEAGLPPLPWGANVEAADARVSEEIRQAERRADLERELQSLVRRAEERALERERAQACCTEADERVAEIRRSVESFLTERRLPPSLDVEGAVSLCESGAGLQETLADLRAEEEKLRADQPAVAEATQALASAARACGITSTDPDALAGLARALLDGQAHLAGRQETEQARLADLERQLRATAAERDDQQHKLAALLTAGAAEDPESFRTRATRAQERSALLQDAAVRRSAVEAAAHLPPEDAALALATLGGAEGASAEVRRLDAEVASLEVQHTTRVEARKSARDELRALETDGRAAELRLQEEGLVARARELARRYAKERIALALLGRARRTFEREQQPRLLQLASEHFGRLTGDRYERVFLPAGEGLELRVVDARGLEHMPERLSRGTREQLYFAFRLAVVQEFGESRGRLPMILDDILVNFDPRRAAAAVEALARLGEGQQVIAFTCQPAVRELFACHGARVTELAVPEFEAPRAAAANE